MERDENREAHGRRAAAGYVAAEPPNDGREWDCQCARCGSSMDWTECWDCGGDGAHDLYDVDPLWYDRDATERCATCEGAGGWWTCLSSSAWCNANPMPGSEAVERGAVEWFCIDRPAT